MQSKIFRFVSWCFSFTIYFSNTKSEFIWLYFQPVCVCMRVFLFDCLNEVIVVLKWQATNEMYIFYMNAIPFHPTKCVHHQFYVQVRLIYRNMQSKKYSLRYKTAIALYVHFINNCENFMTAEIERLSKADRTTAFLFVAVVILSIKHIIVLVSCCSAR